MDNFLFNIYLLNYILNHQNKLSKTIQDCLTEFVSRMNEDQQDNFLEIVLPNDVATAKTIFNCLTECCKKATKTIFICLTEEIKKSARQIV